MNQTLAFTALESVRKSEPEAAKPTTSPNLASRYSLVFVTIVYVLFGAAGFFAAAQIMSSG